MIKALLALDPWAVNGQTRSRILNIKKIYSAVLRSITNSSLKSVHSLSSYFGEQSNATIASLAEVINDQLVIEYTRLITTRN